MVPLSLLGSASVAGIVAVVLWEWGMSERSQITSACEATHSCAQAQMQGVHAKLVVGDVMAAAGAGAAGLGIGLLLFGGRHSTPIGIGMAPTLSGATVGVSGRF